MRSTFKATHYAGFVVDQELVATSAITNLCTQQVTAIEPAATVAILD